MFDMFSMMGKVKELQSKIKEAQDSLKDITVTSEAGGGMVRAKANGLRKLISIEIDETLLKQNDPEMISDLVVAAVNKAMDDAGERAKDEIKKKTEGILPNIPGLDFGNFGV
ncbi:MAG: YbaB/EbfC family nucleoid-associated protein [Hymenobacteraceae bacterium]|nr:YbaB/EbfC family nucleoid-associated protein [Hymenobacteraceae bacterium]MDX5395133.1 YbaB/EbfC family nucleoid-associated protein [Hymenobacteraceae bacterium]MDX5511174.1 YbaB/EbfC family nucleoid-associated protein [Hymenobacteraceae bacterium]